MKLLTKIFKIFLGSTVFIYSVASMAIAPNFTPSYFDMNILRITELVMCYFAYHGISIIVWAVKKNEAFYNYRLDAPSDN
jgi:hypothetical protein